VVEIEFATVWDGIKWHLCRRLPVLKLVLGTVRIMPNDAPATSPEGT
jgi:hypothetical protein